MMNVRVLLPGEVVQFTQMLNESGFYPNLDASSLVGTMCFGIFKDEQLVGGAMVISQGKHAYLDYLYVRPDSRNLGAGPKLLDAVHSTLRNAGLKYVHAVISGANELSAKLAARYYGKMGFPFYHVRIDLEEDHGR